MPDYFVRITLKAQNASEVRKELRATFGASVAKEANVALSTELPDYYQACEANDHFGCVHWSEEDLLSRLEELKIEATPEILDDIKSSYAVRHIADRMIEHGWEAIEQAIAEVQVE